jgi:hypothetical protein
VTNTASAAGSGIAIDSNGVSVRGNQVVDFGDGHDGIVTVDSPGVVLIDGNQVIGWTVGIHTQGDGKTVRKNQVSLSGNTGIWAKGSTTVVGNVVTACPFGINLADYATAIGNSTHGNPFFGFYVSGSDSPFSGSIEKNNVFGNRDCGLFNLDVPGLLAQNNYWGAATGPAADDVCDAGTGTTTVSPFATKPFKVKAPIKP